MTESIDASCVAETDTDSGFASGSCAGTGCATNNKIKKIRVRILIILSL
jgi:hypothetical protein